MAHDLLAGKTERDWSCGIASVPASQQNKPKGKSAAELWDEAESARLHRPIKYMSDTKRPRHQPPPAVASPTVPEPNSPPSSWTGILPVAIGAGVAGLVLLPFLKK